MTIFLFVLLCITSQPTVVLPWLVWLKTQETWQFVCMSARDYTTVHALNTCSDHSHNTVMMKIFFISVNAKIPTETKPCAYDALLVAVPFTLSFIFSTWKKKKKSQTNNELTCILSSHWAQASNSCLGPASSEASDVFISFTSTPKSSKGC